MRQIDSRDYYAPIVGEFEHFVLLALLRLGNGAYGAAIRKEIRERTGRDASDGHPAMWASATVRIDARTLRADARCAVEDGMVTLRARIPDTGRENPGPSSASGTKFTPEQMVQLLRQGESNTAPLQV